MNGRPIGKLAVQGSVRQRHGREACELRYLGFLAATGASWWGIWKVDPPRHDWILYLLVLLAWILVFRPWHRLLQVEMDSSVLRLQVQALGFLTVRSSDYGLAGRRLGVDGRVWRFDARQEKGAGLGCLALALPFPFGLLLSAGSGATKRAETRVRWVLCLQDADGRATEDLALLKDRHVAAPFLAAMREILPDHVGTG